MQTGKITTRKYRTHLLNIAAKTGDHALANLAKTATAATIKNLLAANFMIQPPTRHTMPPAVRLVCNNGL